jgi:hypothetical protein
LPQLQLLGAVPPVSSLLLSLLWLLLSGSLLLLPDPQPHSELSLSPPFSFPSYAPLLVSGLPTKLSGDPRQERCLCSSAKKGSHQVFCPVATAPHPLIYTLHVLAATLRLATSLAALLYQHVPDHWVSLLADSPLLSRCTKSRSRATARGMTLFPPRLSLSFLISLSFLQNVRDRAISFDRTETGNNCDLS